MYLYWRAMWKKILLLLPLFASAAAPARDKAENWIELRSPHFLVATNSSEKQARHVADQFERMRAVFHTLFPKLQMDPGAPIIVLAVNSEKDFRALEPEAYLAKGQLKLGGLFLRGLEKNYVLLRLDAQGEHPYEVVYHEYTHLLMGKAAEWMPLWLNEGLAEFYQNTDIHDKDVDLGQTSVDNIQLLRQQRLLPLTTLFAVDANSPYYHEENKGSIFYAESWALTHYLQVTDYHEKTHRLTDYSDLLERKTDPLTAAQTAFGDLKHLESELNNYVQHGNYVYFRMKTTTEVDDSAFQLQALTPVQADAVCADFLAYNDRIKDARTLLDHVLQEDPKNVAAQETMGFIEFRERHLDEAKKWYAQAVQLDSRSYLAHYYFAAISMMGTIPPADEKQVEDSLRRSIQLNPSFAPSFDQLAVFLGSQHRNLDEAHMMGLTAVGLDPGNVGYRLNVANVLLMMGNAKSAVEVLQRAAKMAKTPQQSEWIDNTLMRAQEYLAQRDSVRAENEENVSETATAPTAGLKDGEAPKLLHREFVASGPHRFVTGVLKNVHCDSSNLDLAVQSGEKLRTLHSDNYYRIDFTSLGFQPKGDLNPCKDLEGRPAKVEYQESANKDDAARLFAVELHK